MATWDEFALGAAEVSESAGPQGGAAGWRPFEPGAAALAAAGERLLSTPPAGIALLATVSPAGRPRVHPFMPRILDGHLLAFIGGHSPKAHDLERRPYTVHAQPAPEDEEFWVSGHAHRIGDQEAIQQAGAAMPWARPDREALFEFGLEISVWTVWLDFGTPSHRPQHRRWRL